MDAKKSISKLPCKPISGFEHTINERYRQVNIIALAYGWAFQDWQPNIGMLSYSKIASKRLQRVNIYLTTMSITTYLQHPKKGKGQLYRKYVTLNLLIKILDNPRIHTNKGYYKK